MKGGGAFARWTGMPGKPTRGRVRLAYQCRALALAVIALSASGCLETATDMAPKISAHQPIERREGVSLADASVAIYTIEGAPAEVAASFTASLKQEAAARDIVLVDVTKARYLVRGYLSATATKDGASLEYVWDVFGADRKLAQRLNDTIEVKGTGDDPWAIAGEKALNSVAAKSADDLAAFLSTTPFAKPLATQALSYAPAQ